MVWAYTTNGMNLLLCSPILQVFLDMVENYPTCLRVLVLAENAISPELQQQISDLLSEGEEEEDMEAEAAPHSRNLLPTREKTTWLPHSSKG